MQGTRATFLGLDIGTSFIKGAVLDLDTIQVKHVQRIPFPEFLPGLPKLHREVDPYRIVSLAGTLLDGLAAHAPDCQGVVLCGQMHGFVLVNRDGASVSNYISWSDQRALDPHPSGAGTHFDVLAERITKSERLQLGNEVRPGLALSSLFWLREQRLLPEGEILPASLPDFVAARVCGGLPSIEATHAAAFGALNLETGHWHRGVIEKLGLGDLRWPQLRKPGEVVGYWRVGSRSVPCYTPVGDQQCALAGSLLGEDELSLNISTGSQVAVIAPHFTPGDYQVRPYFDGRFLKTITHIPAGRALSSLIRLLSELAEVKPDDPWPYIEQAAASVPQTDVRASISFYSGACGDSGRFENLREDNLTIGHLFRAAFESMAENYRDCASRLSTGRNWRRLVFSGGLARRLELLLRLISEKLDAPYRLAPVDEETLFGLLILALVFSGRQRSVHEASAELGTRGC
jgi:sugar (pentulose or hexulose) kinase